MGRGQDLAHELEAITPDSGPSYPQPLPDAPAWAAPGVDRAETSTTFFRMIDLPGEVLVPRLAALWACGSSIEIAGCRLVGLPSSRGSGVVLRGRWRRPMHRLSLPIEIEMWPHLGRWTVVTLAPGRRIRLSRRYYRSGHHLLDQLTAALGAS